MDPSQAGSGVADDLLTHLLDTALYLNGPITRKAGDAQDVRARIARSTTPFLAMLKFANGSVGQFEATRFGIGCRNANSVRDPRRRRACCASTSSA